MRRTKVLGSYCPKRVERARPLSAVQEAKPMIDRNMYSEYFRGKRILVTGGTGSFGNQIVRELLEFSPERIVIYSRDEKKQYDMQDQYGNERRLHFTIGDVRDAGAVMEAMRG